MASPEALLELNNRCTAEKITRKQHYNRDVNMRRVNRSWADTSAWSVTPIINCQRCQCSAAFHMKVSARLTGWSHPLHTFQQLPKLPLCSSSSSSSGLCCFHTEWWCTKTTFVSWKRWSPSITEENVPTQTLSRAPFLLLDCLKMASVVAPCQWCFSITHMNHKQKDRSHNLSWAVLYDELKHSTVHYTVNKWGKCQIEII